MTSVQLLNSVGTIFRTHSGFRAESPASEYLSKGRERSEYDVCISASPQNSLPSLLSHGRRSGHCGCALAHESWGPSILVNGILCRPAARSRGHAGAQYLLVARCRRRAPQLGVVRARMRAIATASLTLEPQIAAHAEQMFVALSDPAIYEYENRPPQSLEWLRQRFTRLESRRCSDGKEQWLNWVIRLPTSELAGYVQATVHADGRAAIAYELSSAHWGRGLARQAVQALMTELAGYYHVKRFTAVLKRGNQRSLRLLERLGFALASPELHAKYDIEPGELLMWREISSI